MRTSPNMCVTFEDYEELSDLLALQSAQAQH
jgi:hypothetical protein